MNTPVHVEGFRQTGKTEMLLDHAVVQAAKGRRVHFRTHDARTARHILELAYTTASQIGIAIPSINYSRSALTFPRGGLLWIWTGGSQAERGLEAPHLEIHDETACRWHPGARFRIGSVPDLDPPRFQGVPSPITIQKKSNDEKESA